MSKSIRFDYKDKEYTLEYTPNSIKQMERRGFVAEDMEKKPMTILPELFAGAFIANHSNVKREKIDEIYEQMNGKTRLVGALIEMYNDVIAAFLGDDEDEGNANWTPSWEIKD